MLFRLSILSQICHMAVEYMPFRGFAASIIFS